MRHLIGAATDFLRRLAVPTKAAGVVIGILLAQPVLAFEPFLYSHGGPEKEVAMRIPGQTNVIDLAGENARWSSAYAPYLDSFVVLLLCKHLDCTDARWRMAYSRLENGTVKTYRSEKVSVFMGVEPVRFQFLNATLFRKGDGSEFTPLSLTLECTKNCPTLSSHWPIIKGFDDGRQTDERIVLDTPTGPVVPWFELYTRQPDTFGSRVAQFALSATGKELGVADEEAVLPSTGIRLTLRMESGQGMPTAVEFEVRKKDEAFRDEETHFASWSEAGKVAHLILLDLEPGKYHWQYRVIDPNNYDTARWIEFRTIGNADFTVPNIVRTPVKPFVSGLRQEIIIGAIGRVYAAEGSGDEDGAFELSANVVSATGNILEIEVKETTEPFDGMDLLRTGIVPWGSRAKKIINVPVGSYRWRARLIDAVDPSKTSSWLEFGVPGNVDFVGVDNP
jgi:hypothetical protein